MADRHKHPPLFFRPGDGDRAWLESLTLPAGMTRNKLLAEMLSEYRQHHPHGPDMPDRDGKPHPRARKAPVAKPGPCARRVPAGAFCKACDHVHG